MFSEKRNKMIKCISYSNFKNCETFQEENKDTQSLGDTYVSDMGHRWFINGLSAVQ